MPCPERYHITPAAASIYRHHGGLPVVPVRVPRDVPPTSPRPIVVSVADWLRRRTRRNPGISGNGRRSRTRPSPLATLPTSPRTIVVSVADELRRRTRRKPGISGDG